MLVQPLRADAAEIVLTTRPLPVRPHRQGNRGDRQPEELSHLERFPQPPFVPRPMFRNPESGHEGGHTAGRFAAATLSGLTSIVGNLATSSGGTVVRPTRVAKASPLLRSSRKVAAVADGASMTTSAHASSHPETTTVRVKTIVMRLRYYQCGEWAVHNRTSRSVWADAVVEPLCNARHRWSRDRETLHVGVSRMFKLIATMRRGNATNLSAAWSRYPTLEAARLGTATLLHDDRIARVMIVRNEIPPAFVEWVER